MTHLLKLPYGLRREGNEKKLLHISEIPQSERGLRCNCVCPKCDERLQAKLPRTKKNFTPRFAHQHAITCDYAAETAIHMKAKEIIEKEKHLILPDFFVEYKGLIRMRPSVRVDFDHVKLEYRIGNIIPDIVAYIKNTPLIIEIKITHGIDDLKSNKIKTLDISAIEIDLSYINADFNPESLYEEIVLNTKNKKWIFNRNKEKEVAILKKKHVEKIEAEQLERKKEEYNRKLIVKSEEKKRKTEAEKATRLKDETLHTKLRNTWSKGFHKHYHWKKATLRGNITNDNIPFYIGVDIPGDIVFGCDRRIWQAYIFDRYIDERGRSFRKKCVSLGEIYQDVCFDFKNMLIQDLIYDKSQYEDTEKNILIQVIHSYLKKLEGFGYLEDQNNGVFKILFAEDSSD